MRFLPWLVVTAALLAAPGDGLARTKESVTMPDKKEIAGHALVLNGMGVREATIFNVKVYVAGLYLEKQSAIPNEILSSTTTKQLVLHFVRDVERDDLTAAFSDGFEKTAGAGAKALADRITKLNGWMQDMKIGQTLIFTELPGRGLEVSVAGKVRGTITGRDFAKAFLGIFVGAHPPNEGLKVGLLGR